MAGAPPHRPVSPLTVLRIMEGHLGDDWHIAGAAVDVRAFLPVGTGSPHGGFCLRSADHESPPGAWTRLDLLTVGDRSLHLGSGHVVMVRRNSRWLAGDTVRPLTRGQIRIQSEGGEVYFRGLRIRPLAAMPREYARCFE